MSYYKIGETFRWFIARVADIHDPEYLGRVKIRVINQQTGDLGKKSKSFGITDDDLLWAWPISAVQSASLHWQKIKEEELEGFDVPDFIDAVGLSPTGIAVGTYVFGFYLDSFEQNIPMIFGTYHKRSRFPEPPTDATTGKMLQIAESEGELFNDVAALARGETGGGGQTLPKEPYEEGTLKHVIEPPTAYATEYPYNTTYTTKSGHAIELDDTPTSERIHIWHKSGSYEEIANSADGEGFIGRRVKKTTDSDFEIILKDKHLLVRGNLKVEVDVDSDVRVVNSSYVEIGNNSTVSIGNNSVVEIGNNSTVTIGNNSTVDIGGSSTTTIGAGCVINVTGDTQISTSGNMDVSAGGTMNISAGGAVNISGSTINLN